jgi:hypothetical protein
MLRIVVRVALLVVLLDVSRVGVVSLMNGSSPFLGFLVSPGVFVCLGIGLVALHGVHYINTPLI